MGYNQRRGNQRRGSTSKRVVPKTYTPMMTIYFTWRFVMVTSATIREIVPVSTMLPGPHSRPSMNYKINALKIEQ